MGKIRVLYFVDRMLRGGIQVFLENVCRYIDKNKFKIEILVLDDGKNYAAEEKVFTDMGIAVYKLNGIWLNNFGDYRKYKTALDKFFSEHKYDIVHVNSGPKNFIVVKEAKKFGIPVRIYHSHNTDYQTKNKIKKLYGDLLKRKVKKYSTHFCACSEVAGTWMFGKKIMASGKVIVIKNGIRLDEYKYNEALRQRKRKELGVDNQILIGNVGRFAPQKNHAFLLNIYAEIRKMRSDSMLMLIGVGEFMDSIQEKAKELGIYENVKFLGFRSDVSELTQAMDVFLMPSFYEGFPVTAVEAQASGVPCVFSNTITKEAALLDETIYIDLNTDAKYWATRILELIGKSDRKKSYQVLKVKGFDIGDVAKRLECIYSGEDFK